MPPEKLSPKQEKGISIEQCILKAQNYIDKQGVCLFLYDVKGSRDYSIEDRFQLQVDLSKTNEEITYKFTEYLPPNKLATFIRTDIGPFLLGDGSLVGINNAEVIPKIAAYLKEKLPLVSFHFDVAKDGHDDEAMRIIK